MTQTRFTTVLLCVVVAAVLTSACTAGEAAVTPTTEATLQVRFAQSLTLGEHAQAEGTAVIRHDGRKSMAMLSSVRVISSKPGYLLIEGTSDAGNVYVRLDPTGVIMSLGIQPDDSH